MAGRVLRESGQQFAAMPLMRRGGELQVMLLTSRGTGRWVLPKGWAEQDLTGPEVAAKEAAEEAGLLGEVLPDPLGTYGYRKEMPQDRTVPCTVTVFAMRVDRLLEDWPERTQRERRWFSLPDAAERVLEEELRRLLMRMAEWQGPV